MMKRKFLITTLCFLLAGCGAPAHSTPTVSPASTPINDGLPKLSAPYDGPLELVALETSPDLCDPPSPFDLPSENMTWLGFLPNRKCDEINSALEVFETGDQLYVAQRNARGFRLVNVTDPEQPFELGAWKFEPTAGKGHITAFRQFDRSYLAVPLESPSPYVDKPCGIAIIDVTQPEEPVLSGRYDGEIIDAVVPWCNVHDVQVDTDAAGNAVYLMLTTPNTADLRVLDIRSLNDIREVNYYHSHIHPHGEYGSWAHLSTITEDRVYVALWGGGVMILDKQKLAAGAAPEDVAITSPGSIDPEDFVAHDTIPTPDGNFLFVNDMDGLTDGIRLFDIRDLANPREVWKGDFGDTVIAHHTLRIAGDLLFVPWFSEGLRVFRYDVSNPDLPVVEQVAYQAVRPPPYEKYGGVSDLKVHACKVGGIAQTCIYASDEEFGLIILTADLP